MEFELDKAVQILQQTPHSLSRMLVDLSPEWTKSRGQIDNWSPYDIIGHLIHGEETDWIPRAKMILASAEPVTFAPYDRLAQFERSKERSLDDLLTEFAHLRSSNLESLLNWQLTPEKLNLTAVHPELGQVTLRQLLATWVVHDLNQISQIVKSMSNEYGNEVGPWRPYLSILTK